jgi:uncharacterized MnhB-related membrane protein
MWDKIAAVVKPFAPAIANALTGNVPGAVAGVAIALKNTLFGKADVSDDELLTSLQNITPEQRLAIVQADIEMARIEGEQEKVRLADVADARSASVELAKLGQKDYGSWIIAGVILFGFFGIAAYTMHLFAAHDVNPEEAAVLSFMLGGLMTEVQRINIYKFGGSIINKTASFLKNDK